jgi:hypothetical protein
VIVLGWSVVQQEEEPHALAWDGRETLHIPYGTINEIREYRSRLAIDDGRYGTDTGWISAAVSHVDCGRILLGMSQ